MESLKCIKTLICYTNFFPWILVKFISFFLGYPVKHEPKSHFSFDITPYIFLKGRGTKSRIELRGGRSRNEGNVFVDGKPVCDDMWDENDAIVACRMLG